MQATYAAGRGRITPIPRRSMPIAARAGPRRSMCWSARWTCAARELGVDPLGPAAAQFHSAGPAFPIQPPRARPMTWAISPGCWPRRGTRPIVPALPRAGPAARRGASCGGMGLCYYIESILGDPSEGATGGIPTEDRRRVPHLSSARKVNGQGHETVYAQFLSDQTGIPAERIRVVQGDSDLIAQGGGTGGSRSVTVQANATLATVDVMMAALRALSGRTRWAWTPEDVAFDDERFRAAGVEPDADDAGSGRDGPRGEARADLLRARGARDLAGARSFPTAPMWPRSRSTRKPASCGVDRYTVDRRFRQPDQPVCWPRVRCMAGWRRASGRR